MSKPGADPCMGLSESSGELSSPPLSFVPSLCSTGAIIPSSQPALRLRRGARELSRLAVAPTLRDCSAFARPHLDSFEHDGTLGAIGMTIRGEPAFGRDQSRHNLVFGGCKNPTMMQPCASAAKLRDGGPILPLGMTAMSHLGTPPPRTVIGDPVTSGRTEPKLLGAFSVLRL
jgi:hypothetical protein